jgi:plastocyanin
VFATTGVPAGGTSTVPTLSQGTHLFECMIHPWMRTTVVVRADDD